MNRRNAETTPPRPEHGQQHQKAARLLQAGYYAEAIAFADSVYSDSPDSPDMTGVLIIKLKALLNLQRVQDCPAVLDTLWPYLQRPDAPLARVAKFHALAAQVALHQGSMQRCIMQLVRSAQMMPTAPADVDAMNGWLTIADGYSLAGFHKQAVAAQQNARKISERGTAADRAYSARPRILVRYAAFLDQQGDEREATSILKELNASIRPEDVNSAEHPYLGYASARHAVLGGPCRPDTRLLLHADAGGPQENAELIRLGETALAIVEGRPGEALILLDDESATYSLLGRGEVARLRSLAQAALGDHDAAHESAREVARVLWEAARDLYALVIDGGTDSLNYEEVQRNARRYADEAMTDPLTGLPNRRHLERYLGELAGTGVHAIGVIDLDRFKDVNTMHGHLAGDQVLEQAAGLISRSLRRGDFLARFGGDEFVLVLPGTTVPDARSITDRLSAVVAEYDWDHLVPGTPVTVTVGLAQLDRHTGTAEAFKTADIRMLKAKATSTRARAAGTDRPR